MNIIIIDDENVKLKTKAREVKCDYHLGQNFFDISKIKINVLKNCTINIHTKSEEIKADIEVIINDNVNCCINNITTISKGKIKYTYNISCNSNLKINKFNDSNNIKELVVTNLNGENASINYNFKSIGNSKEVYDLQINHNFLNTTSDIKNNIVNINGNIMLGVSTIIKKGIKNCVANQNNKIINLTNKKCEIKPNLYIDEFDSLANHSAYIGKFSRNELFYLMSRGLSERQATNLLIKGVLISDIDEPKLLIEINDILNKYWR